MPHMSDVRERLRHRPLHLISNYNTINKWIYLFKMLFSCHSSFIWSWTSSVCVSVCSCCPSGLLSGPGLQCSWVLWWEVRWKPLPLLGPFCLQVQGNKRFRYCATTVTWKNIVKGFSVSSEGELVFSIGPNHQDHTSVLFQFDGSLRLFCSLTCLHSQLLQQDLHIFNYI